MKYDQLATRLIFCIPKAILVLFAMGGIIYSTAVLKSQTFENKPSGTINQFAQSSDNVEYGEINSTSGVPGIL